MSVNSISSSTISTILQNTVTPAPVATDDHEQRKLDRPTRRHRFDARRQRRSGCRAASADGGPFRAHRVQRGRHGATRIGLRRPDQPARRYADHAGADHPEPVGNPGLERRAGASADRRRRAEQLHVADEHLGGRRLRLRRDQQRRRADCHRRYRDANGGRQRLSVHFRVPRHVGQRQHDQRRCDDQLS